MSPSQRLDSARALMAMEGGWPRSVPLLIRQALEQELASRVEELLPGSSKGTTSLQLIALKLLGSDEALALQVALAWHGLSEACHHNGYELAPLSGQLTDWLETTEGFVRSQGIVG